MPTVSGKNTLVECLVGGIKRIKLTNAINAKYDEDELLNSEYCYSRKPGETDEDRDARNVAYNSQRDVIKAEIRALTDQYKEARRPFLKPRRPPRLTAC